MNNIILKPATMADSKLLMDWRNDPETIKASHNSKAVTIKKHFEWLKNTIKNPDKQLFIAWKISGIIGNKYGDIGDVLQPVGTIRSDYHLEENCYELSWTVAPKARGQGIGKQMVSTLAKRMADKNIRAEIKPENVASIKIAEAAGMKFDKVEYRYTSDTEKEPVLHYYRVSNITCTFKDYKGEGK